MKKVAVIGGGASGMIAAGTAARAGNKVYLIEKNERLGKKLRITGKGRCNITNAAEISDFFAEIPTNPKFLYSALYSFTNRDIVALLEGLGVAVKTERGGRIFPVSDNANDVADALKRYALHKNTSLIRKRAGGIVISDGRAAGVNVGKTVIDADAVIVCTGGVSYPKTGSDGDGYRFARTAGHKIVSPEPSLIPVVTKEKWTKDLMGLTLKNVGVSLVDGERVVYSDFGEMLFTHFGLSGPVILSMSSHMKNIKETEYKILIDLKPALDLDTLNKRVLSDFEKFRNKHLVNSLDELLPKAIIPVIIYISGISPHTPVNMITKNQRMRLIEAMKKLTLTVSGFRPISEAIITSGGVSTKEINPKTMESKLVRGLYFAGEVIDVDAYTGGYNLQIAYSTGYLAGSSV